MYVRSTGIGRVRISGLAQNPPSPGEIRHRVGPGDIVRMALNLERLNARAKEARDDGASLRRFAAAAGFAAAAVMIFSQSGA